MPLRRSLRAPIPLSGENDSSSEKNSFQSLRFGQRGCAALLTTAAERDKRAILSTSEDNRSHMLDRQADAQPLAEDSAFATIRAVIAVRRPHVFCCRITGQPPRPPVFRPTLSQPLDAAQRRLTPTTGALGAYTSVVRISFDC